MMGERKRRYAVTAKKRAARKPKPLSFAERCLAYSRAKMAQSTVNPLSMTDEMHDRLAKGAGL